MPEQFAVVTIAVGKEYYLNLARNLLLSFLLWNRDNDIHFLLVTDNRSYFEEFFQEEKVNIKNIVVSDEERSFTSKFLLFDQVTAAENLFVDCDCIIYNDLRAVFEQFKNQDFSVIGENVQEGSFFCDIKSILKQLDLSYFPQFVGAVYYFKNNEIAKSIVDLAKELKRNYDHLGFIRLRGKENEEPLFATAMAKFNQHPIKDDGTIKADAMFYDQFDCNVLAGKAVLQRKNIAPHAYAKLKTSRPAIVHYNDRYTELATYLSEQFRLNSTLPKLARNWVAKMRYSLPSFLTNELKKLFRPIYHQVLGPSKIKAIKRLEVNKPLYLFYEEPDPDRWVKYDHIPRKLIRRIVRGKTRPGGVMMVALALMKGLDLLKIPYRFNDYRYAKENPSELICVIGKPHLIFGKKFKNPILFGAGVFSHPMECPDFFEKYPNVKKMLVPGEWMRLMCEPFYPNKVMSWPVGIDTSKWSPKIKNSTLSVDFLIYDKIRWKHPHYEKDLISPIIEVLNKKGLSYHMIKYGTYQHADLLNEISISKAAIFLCEHETQGLAYQQILATNTPILAWDEEGYWKDPSFYPHLVQYQPVSSVPYWDESCGLKFMGMMDFEVKLEEFLSKLNHFSPRTYILNHLTLELSAQQYVNIVKSVNEDLTNS